MKCSRQANITISLKVSQMITGKLVKTAQPSGMKATVGMTYHAMLEVLLFAKNQILYHGKTYGSMSTSKMTVDGSVSQLSKTTTTSTVDLKKEIHGMNADHPTGVFHKKTGIAMTTVTAMV